MRTISTIVSFIFLISVSHLANGQTIQPLKTNKNDINVIDLTVGFKNIQSVKLSEIADSITFIPFETTRESLMGGGQKNMIFSKPYIFYSGKYFDWTGKFCGEIIKKGQGPFEEPEGGSLAYIDNKFYSRGSKFIEYGINGKPTGKVRHLYADSREFKENDFLRGGTDFFWTGDNFAVYNYPATLYFFNRNFETVASRKVIQEDCFLPYLPPLGEGKFITYYKENILFYNFMNDTIFSVSDTVLTPRWVVRFDHPSRLPTKVMLEYRQIIGNFTQSILSGSSYENTELVQLTDHKHKVTAVYETDSRLFFVMQEIIHFVEDRKKEPPEIYMMCYDKNTGKVIRIKGKGFIDDLLGMDFYFPTLGFFDNRMISYLWPFEIIDYVEECRKRGREVNPQLKALSQKIDAEDNPILILVHLKKNI